MSEQPMTLRDTARGIAVRAGILSVGGVIAGGLILSLGMKAASAVVRALVGLFALAVIGGVATYQFKKFQRNHSATRAGS